LSRAKVQVKNSEHQKGSSMSRTIAGSIKTIVMAILVGLLLISLAIWGVSDAFTPNSSDAAAMVGKEKIKLTEFDRSFRNRLRDENRTRENRITTKDAYGEGLHREVITQMITRTLLNQDADDLGVDINSRDALAFVEGLGTFNNELTGKYDKQKLGELLSRQNNGTTVKKFEQNVYDDLRLEQTLSGVTTGIVAPPDYGKQQYKYMTEQRKVKMLTFDRNAIVPPPDPSDEDLKTYISDNVARYTAPEYRQFTVLRMELAEVLPDMEATDEEIQSMFGDKIRVGQLGTAETRSLLQYVVPDEETANNITAALNAGETAENIQSDFGVDEPLTFENILPNGTTDTVTGEIGFELAVGEAKSVKGSFGTWYSVLATQITPADVPTIEGEKETLVSEIKQNNAEKFIYDALDKIQQSLDEGETLEAAALANGVAVASYDYVSRLGLNQEDQRMQGLNQFVGIASDDKILTEIFTSDVGFEGDAFETSSEGIAAVRVNNILDSKPKAFEAVKEQALQDWHLEKADESLATLTQEVLTRVNAGEALEDILKDYQSGASIRENILIRASRIEGVSGALAVRIFDAGSDESFYGLAANGLDRIVGKVVSIMPNEDTLVGSIADSFKQKAEKLLNEDIQQAYRAALMQDYPPRTIQENIDRVLGIDNQ
jgi:peptidyl-prolyl cis-trans isomerase D